MPKLSPVMLALGHGVLTINKPRGWTSHDVVAKIRRRLGGPKVGHAGTLDPAATGVLLVLVGQGTRIAEYLTEWDKEYHVVLRLGQTTDTQDATGTILHRRSAAHLTEAEICTTVARFKGSLSQVPPMYSAVKVGGVPLYKAARAGKTLERSSRPVTVHDIEVLSISGPDISLHVLCSKGTYVRTLCADIGDVLGVGGHVMTLQRRRVGPLTLEHALEIDEIDARYLDGRLAQDLLPLDAALAALPELVVGDATAARVRHGVPVPWEKVEWDKSSCTAVLVEGRPVRVKDVTGRLLALGVAPVGFRTSGDEPPEMMSRKFVAISKVLVGG